MNEQSGRPAPERDDIATLVRIAGKRQPVPGDRLERVRDAARIEWRVHVKRRARNRRLWTTGALAAAATLALVAFLQLRGGEPAGIHAPLSDETIVVEAVSGEAWRRGFPGAAARPDRSLSIGDRLAPGFAVTTGPQSRLAIRMPSGHSIRLDHATDVHLRDHGSLDLAAGAIYVDSGGTAAGPIRVETAYGIVRDVGTQFEVRLEQNGLRVRLREGSVVLQREGAFHEVTAGVELSVDSAGSISRSGILVHAPAWDWIAGVTPMIELEGRSADSFLKWVAREKGWTLQYSDGGAARSARETVLGGTSGRLTVDDALDAVLPACRLTYRIVDGRLVIDRAT